MVAVDPNMGEAGSYNRRDPLVDYRKQNISMSWEFATGQAPATMPRCRIMIDGIAASDWQLPTEDSDNKATRYTFALIVPNGHHCAWVEVEGMTVTCHAVPFVVNDTGAALPDEMQCPWMAVNRFDVSYGSIQNCVVQVKYSKFISPKAKPFKARALESFNGTFLPKKQRWARNPTENMGARAVRRFAKTPLGDVVIEDDNKYFHEDAITAAHLTAPRKAPSASVYDGPRGTLDHVADILIREGNKGAYMLSTSGRFVLLKEDGTVITEVGQRVKPGELKVHNGVNYNTYLHWNNIPLRDAARQAYVNSFERFEDWTLNNVPGPHELFEPWGFATAMRRPDGSITYRDGHEFWICNTRYHCIDFADHWTAHSEAGFQFAHFPPPGYVQSPTRTGRTTMAAFIGNRGTATDYCNEPWVCRFRKQDGKLYWTNFGNNSIYRCNIDGSEIEPVVVSTLHPTWQQLGTTGRLGQPNLGWQNYPQYQPPALRAAWCVDGLAIGEASCIKPTSFDFDSEGNLIWAEHYTYALRKYDFATGRVTTLPKAIHDRNGGSDSSGNREPSIVIDDEGTFGPVDDIFCTTWAGLGDRRFSKDAAALRESWLFNSGKYMSQGGPGHLADGPNYGWGIDVYGGRAMAVGNAAGWQMVEYSKRLPTDPADPDEAKWKRGYNAWSKSGFAIMIHGPEGQCGLGFEDGIDLALLPDDALKARLTELNVDAASLDDVVYYLRQVLVNREV